MPLIAWTIRAAQESGVCVDIMVSTDDPEIAGVAKQSGAHVPALRPSDLATDTASSVDVALHALGEFEKCNDPVDGLMLLQPTSPFRTGESIKAAVALFEEDAGRRPVVSVGPASCHPAWCFRLSGQQMVPLQGWEFLSKRSQDLEATYMLTGSIYIIAPQLLRKYASFLTRDFRAIIVDRPIENIDIDTELDWSMAEAALSVIKARQLSCTK